MWKKRMNKKSDWHVSLSAEAIPNDLFFIYSVKYTN